ncbi:MAG: hypothetical protein V4696_05810 [Pseudomonadota bacterium]
MKIAVAIMTLVGLATVVPAAAQTGQTPPAGSRIPRAPGEAVDSYQYSREENDREFASYSNCVVASGTGQRYAGASRCGSI